MIEDLIYLPSMFVAENELGDMIGQGIRSRTQKIATVTTGLAAKQPQAVLNACTRSLSMITGGPGTGKTTSTRQVIKSFRGANMKGIVMAPTGKAAKRSDEVINAEEKDAIPCSTMHIGMGWSEKHQRFTYNRHNKMPYDYVLLDEWSMAGLALAHSFFEAIDFNRTRVVLVGDQHQLPSIDPGNVCRDMINSGVVPCVELDQVFRTGKNSGIAINAQRILHGENLTAIDPRSGVKFDDFFFVPRTSEQATVSSILEWVSEKLPAKYGFDPMRDIQVLSPGKKSVAGSLNLNEKLRERLNPKGEKFGKFRVGDRVINNKNNWQQGMTNGDVGVLTDIVSRNGTKFPFFDFGGKSGLNGNGIVDYLSPSQLEDISLAYSFTIHKSQGSEFPCVVMPIHKCHYKLLFRNLFYTGVTRARQLTVIVGDPQAVKRCLTNNEVAKRSTRLQSIIQLAAQRSS